jgi:transposase InsO family protein
MPWPWRRQRFAPLGVHGVTSAPGEVAEAAYPGAPGRLMVADLGVAGTDAGPLYLAAVLDCYSRGCLGWWTDTRLGPHLIHHAVEEATDVLRRSLSGSRQARGDPVLALSARCAVAGVEVPPGSSPAAVDGAVAESFFATLRSELAGSPAWRTRTDAAEAISSWIRSVYNSDRVGFQDWALAEPA